ncbi:hypothetical protein [Parapedobacter tibetensis]|uniref:hypothetical protein n=1 Tax=Parapedobacter tibetensis TaxID=2972951 RepID=UPI00214D77EC|nr:hypothetical protein [Parapedobacter tibetensis]
MKTKFKLSVLAVFSLCLVTLSSFVTSTDPEAPAAYVPCETDSFELPSYAKVDEIVEVECTVCELVRSERLWNTEGLLEGTLYEYNVGSEPAILYNIDCMYSRDERHSCTQQEITGLGSGCNNFFVPCTKEDDPECVND